MVGVPHIGGGGDEAETALEEACEEVSVSRCICVDIGQEIENNLLLAATVLEFPSNSHLAAMIQREALPGWYCRALEVGMLV
jgi:MOSC domain-containing protein YiiM